MKVYSFHSLLEIIMTERLITLVRDSPIDQNGPITAQVPESEVESWLSYEWYIPENSFENLSIETEEPITEIRRRGRKKKNA